MNWFDYTILGVIALSAIISIARGFLKEAISLVIWISAFFISRHFYPYLASYLTNVQDSIIRNGISVAILFVGSLIAGSLVSYLISQLVKSTGLTGTDKALGAVFGALRGVLIISAILFFLDTFTAVPTASWWQDSMLVPEFALVIQWFFEYMEQSSSFISSII